MATVYLAQDLKHDRRRHQGPHLRQPPGKPQACYRSALDGSALEQVTPDSARNGQPRPGGGAVVYRKDGAWWVRTVADKRTQRIPNLPNAYGMVRWSPDGTALWGLSPPDQQHVERVNVATGQRIPLVTLDLSAQGNTVQLGGITLADDPRVYAMVVVNTSALVFSIRNAQ